MCVLLLVSLCCSSHLRQSRDKQKEPRKAKATQTANWQNRALEAPVKGERPSRAHKTRLESEPNVSFAQQAAHIAAGSDAEEARRRCSGVQAVS